MAGILSKFELDFLRGKVQLDEKAAYNVRYRLKKKLKDLAYLELPLLLDYERRTSTSLMKKNESVIILRARYSAMSDKRTMPVCFTPEQLKAVEEYAKKKGMLNVSQAVEELAK